MEGFKNSEGQIIVENMISTIEEQSGYLSEIDGAIGDGDHGINMKKGFLLCRNKLEGKSISFSDSLNVLGKTLLTEIGGSMGPLYGTLFMKMAKAVSETEIIGLDDFYSMVEAAFTGITSISTAKPGDKTLVDTLAPALNSLKKSVDEKSGFKSALDEMKISARAGWESTKDMISNVGRSSRLGERSRGVLDAGATSCYFILASMADSASKLIDVQG